MSLVTEPLENVVTIFTLSEVTTYKIGRIDVLL